MARVPLALFLCLGGFWVGCLPVAPAPPRDAGVSPVDGGSLATDGGPVQFDGGPVQADGGAPPVDGGGASADGGRPAYCPPLPEPSDGGPPEDGGPPPGFDGGPGELSLGQLCSEDASCASGYCTEGVCCESRCPGPCRSCTRPGALGRCSTLPTYTDVEGCGLYTCNGQGGCFASCANSRACSASNDAYCDMPCNACLPRIIDGPCRVDYECASGYCSSFLLQPDGTYAGVCCNERCANPCTTCRALPGDPTEGICRWLPCCYDGGAPCSDQCSSDAHCIPGYACVNGTCVPR